MSVGLEQIQPGDWEPLRRGFEIISKHLRPPMPNARVYSTAAHGAIANGATGTVLFDTEEWDVGAMHSTTANTGRLTAPITGVYLVTATAAMNAAVGGRVIPFITKNGVLAGRGTSMTNGAAEGEATTIVRLVRGDYVEFQLQNLSGAAITPFAGIGHTWLSACRLGGYANEGVA